MIIDPQQLVNSIKTVLQRRRERGDGLGVFFIDSSDAESGEICLYVPDHRLWQDEFDEPVRPQQVMEWMNSGEAWLIIASDEHDVWFEYNVCNGDNWIAQSGDSPMNNYASNCTRDAALESYTEDGGDADDWNEEDDLRDNVDSTWYLRFDKMLLGEVMDELQGNAPQARTGSILRAETPAPNNAALEIIDFDPAELP